MDLVELINVIYTYFDPWITVTILAVGAILYLRLIAWLFEEVAK
jgi:hypothetical protein